MGELSQRDMLYNVILKTIKEHSAGLEVGLVRAVLNEVDGAIAMMVNRSTFDTVCTKLAERMPRECGQHSRGDSQ